MEIQNEKQRTSSLTISFIIRNLAVGDLLFNGRYTLNTWYGEHMGKY
jgi:hypothetical protein